MQWNGYFQSAAPPEIKSIFRSKARPEFELLAPVVFNCVCIRLRGLDDDANRRALKQLVDSGLAFLGPAYVKGRNGLRACFMNLRTTEADVDLILDRLARKP